MREEGEGGDEGNASCWVQVQGAIGCSSGAWWRNDEVFVRGMGKRERAEEVTSGKPATLFADVGRARHSQHARKSERTEMRLSLQ